MDLGRTMHSMKREQQGRTTPLVFHQGRVRDLWGWLECSEQEGEMPLPLHLPPCAEVGGCGQVWLSGLSDTGPRLTHPGRDLKQH